MPVRYRIAFDGEDVNDEFLAGAGSLQVEENLEMPSAFQLRVPVTRSESGDVTGTGEGRFAPFASVAVVVTPEDGGPQCIFDGVVLSQRLHLEPGANDSTLEVWGEDSSWQMNLEQKVKEWSDVTDADVAASIFGDYNIAPASGNSADASPSHTESKHTLMQRATDIQFLRMLAKRGGKLCWVAAEEAPGVLTGHFEKPSLDGAPSATLVLGTNGNVTALDFEWEVNRPTVVRARTPVFDSAEEDGVGGETSDSGLRLLADRGLADFSGKTMTVMLATLVDDAGELTARSEALLREAGWFVRCRGETELSRLGAVLRPGTVVRVDAAGSLNSGKYFVWSVRHLIDVTAHRMHFELVRNAVGGAA